MVGGALIPDGHGVFVHGSLPSLMSLTLGQWSCNLVFPKNWYTEFSCIPRHSSTPNMNHKPHKYHKCKYKHQYKQVHPKVHRMPGDLGSLVHHQQGRDLKIHNKMINNKENPLRWRLEEDGDGNPVDQSQWTPRCFPLSMISLSLWFAPQQCLLPQPWCPRKWWREWWPKTLLKKP